MKHTILKRLDFKTCNKWMNLLEIGEDDDGEEEGEDGDGIEDSSH